MVIVFDLDDTLYEELAFVRSGYRAVADYLSPILKIGADEIYEGLIAELQSGRTGAFDRYLHKQGIYGKQWIKKCLAVYRGHKPSLTLFPEAIDCLNRLHDHLLYVVTDGNHLVQRKKYLALGLEFYVRRCFFTYAHGLHRSKPSPYCFEKICQLEKVPPASVVYVADNPHKDFVGIKPLGFKTIRVLTGPYRNDVVEEAYEAQFKIPDLKALTGQFLKQVLEK